MILKPSPASAMRVLLGTLLILGIALTGLTDAQTVQKPAATGSKAADDSLLPQPNATNNSAVPEVDNFSFSADGAVANNQFTLTKTRGRIITGTVKDSNGKPIEGAYVGGGAAYASPPYGKSKADGTFRFLYQGRNLDGANLCQIYAVKPGVGFAYLVTDERNDKPPGRISAGSFHLVLDKPRTVQVCVTDEKGTPIPGAIVSPDTIHIGIAARQMNAFRPNNLAPPVFFQRTNADGIATFDWIPTTDLTLLTFKAEGPKKAVKMPDGTSKEFGQSQHVDWSEKKSVITATLPQRAKVKLKVVKADGSPAKNVKPSLRWTSKTRPAVMEGVRLGENGEAEIVGNAGDIFDIRSTSNNAEYLVFSTVGNVNLGNGSEVKELKLTAKKGTKVFGNVVDTDGKPIEWSGKYLLGCWESNNPNVAQPQAGNELFGIVHRRDDAMSYEIYLPPGTFTFKVSSHDQQKGERLFDTQTITIADEPEIRLDLRLHK
jgi:protocatechuate 3,4-dioxygenase beta subunit